MEQLTTAEFVGLILISCLVLCCFIFYHDKEKAILQGFNEDYIDFLMDIRSTNDLRILAALEKAIRVFHHEYKKHVVKEVVDDACGKLQAAIHNRRAQLQQNTNFLTAS